MAQNLEVVELFLLIFKQKYHQGNLKQVSLTNFDDTTIPSIRISDSENIFWNRKRKLKSQKEMSKNPQKKSAPIESICSSDSSDEDCDNSRRLINQLEESNRNLRQTLQQLSFINLA